VDFVFVEALTLFGNKPADCKIRIISSWRKILEEKTKRLCEKYGIKSRII